MFANCDRKTQLVAICVEKDTRELSEDFSLEHF